MFMFDYKKYPKKTLIARVEAPAFRGATVATTLENFRHRPLRNKTIVSPKRHWNQNHIVQICHIWNRFALDLIDGMIVQRI
jgi:hypothetical protein